MHLNMSSIKLSSKPIAFCRIMSMKTGFAIVAEEAFINQIVTLEHEFHESAGFYDSLGTTYNLPHTTLFQGEMRDEINYKEIANDIAREYIKLSTSLILHFTEIKYVPSGWYFLLCLKSKELLALHNYVLKRVEPYLILPEDRMKRDFSDLTKAQREAIFNFNYRYAGKAFCPHVTIGRSTGRNKIILSKMNSFISTFNLSPYTNRITVYNMGRNGTHENTLYEVIIPRKI